MTTKRRAKADVCDMPRAFKDYRYAREQLVRFGMGYEYIADSPFPLPGKRELAEALQRGALLACAVTNQDGFRKRASPPRDRRVERVVRALRRISAVCKQTRFKGQTPIAWDIDAIATLALAALDRRGRK